MPRFLVDHYRKIKERQVFFITTTTGYGIFGRAPSGHTLHWPLARRHSDGRFRICWKRSGQSLPSGITERSLVQKRKYCVMAFSGDIDDRKDREKLGYAVLREFLTQFRAHVATPKPGLRQTAGEHQQIGRDEALCRV
jgi:hypothetical protein